ncbi:unnamed protein product [Ostreobium quekettii]|uniref:Uncharacterized protein n=1 Tax=Ostreobium quekettii TaxID=121088 RepID=A0A8S1J833_9CHLO|nr:unnamed protein product [Ostreobium quekettii]
MGEFCFSFCSWHGFLCISLLSVLKGDLGCPCAWAELDWQWHSGAAHLDSVGSHASTQQGSVLGMNSAQFMQQRRFFLDSFFSSACSMVLVLLFTIWTEKGWQHTQIEIASQWLFAFLIIGICTHPSAGQGIVPELPISVKHPSCLCLADSFCFVLLAAQELMESLGDMQFICMLMWPTTLLPDANCAWAQ